LQNGFWHAMFALHPTAPDTGADERSAAQLPVCTVLISNGSAFLALECRYAHIHSSFQWRTKELSIEIGITPLIWCPRLPCSLIVLRVFLFPRPTYPHTSSFLQVQRPIRVPSAGFIRTYTPISTLSRMRDVQNAGWCQSFSSGNRRSGGISQ